MSDQQDELFRIAYCKEPPKTAFELSLKQAGRDIDDYYIEKIMGRPVPSLEEFREGRKQQRGQELMDFISDTFGLPRRTYVDELRVTDRSGADEGGGSSRRENGTREEPGSEGETPEE